MADLKQLEILETGVDVWNEWRRSDPAREVDLSEASLINADLSRADLSGVLLERADLSKAQLSHATLHGARLNGATFTLADLLGTVLNEADLENASFFGAVLFGTRLKSARLRGANLFGANLMGADLSFSDLSGAYLMGANFHEANLSSANLTGANLTSASLIGTRVDGAVFQNCLIHGISAWNLVGTPEKEEGLVVTSKGEPHISVSSLEVAQLINPFIYPRGSMKLVGEAKFRLGLICGRFRSKRRSVYESISAVLKRAGWAPVLLEAEPRCEMGLGRSLNRLGKAAGLVVVDLTGVNFLSEALKGSRDEISDRSLVLVCERSRFDATLSSELAASGLGSEVLLYESQTSCDSFFSDALGPFLEETVG